MGTLTLCVMLARFQSLDEDERLLDLDKVLTAEPVWCFDSSIYHGDDFNQTF